MKKKLKLIILLIVISIVLLIVFTISYGLISRDCIIVENCLTGRKLIAKVGDEINDVKIIQIEQNKVIVEHDNKEMDYEYGETCEFYPEGVFAEYPDTKIIFRKFK